MTLPASGRARDGEPGDRDDDVGRRALDEIGEDPDPRFTFANERTFLAWNRTALALVVTGLAVVQFLKHGVEAARLAVAVPMIVLGAVVAFMSLGRWEARERAMRLKRPLPSTRLPAVVAAGVGIVAVLAAILAVVNVIADG